MGTLFQADQKSLKELEANTGIEFEKLKESLETLEKKHYIIKEKEEDGFPRYSLSGKGRHHAEESIKDGNRELLSRLNEEEREQLELLLRKLLP
ncbi:MAG: hypothetical protein K0R23_491 [Lacrimispora sp.]|nr:hypothetical protein [Lacrimispora sp.]